MMVSASTQKKSKLHCYKNCENKCEQLDFQHRLFGFVYVDYTARYDFAKSIDGDEYQSTNDDIRQSSHFIYV